MSTGSRVSRLESTLTRRASVTPLSSTLTRPSRKSIKTRDFNSISCHTYEGSSASPLDATLTKRGWGVASDFCEGRSARPERCSRASYASPDRSGRVPIPSGGEGGTSHQSRITGRESRSESRRMHKAVVNVLGRALECSGRSISALCEERW